MFEDYQFIWTILWEIIYRKKGIFRKYGRSQWVKKILAHLKHQLFSSNRFRQDRIISIRIHSNESTHNAYRPLHLVSFRCISMRIPRCIISTSRNSVVKSCYFQGNSRKYELALVTMSKVNVVLVRWKIVRDDRVG